MTGDLVSDARDRYLASNGFSLREYEAKTFAVRLFGMTIHFPNLRARRRVIPLHDLHHIATGYGTDLCGEAEQSAWELRAGINAPVLWLLKLTMITIGILLAPRRTLRAFRRARGATTLYVHEHRYDELLAMTVEALRDRLGVPRGGYAGAPPRREA